VSDKTILLADDDADLLDLLTQHCTQRGYSVIGVNNALDAINAIHRARPDLVCIDVNMPAGNGLSVCEMMAGDERLRSIPVVVLTGNCSECTIRRCHDMLIYYVEKNADIWSRIDPLFDELLGREPETSSQLRQPQAAQKSPPAAGELMDAVFAMLGSDAGYLNEARANERPAELAPPAPNEPPWVLSIDDDADFSDALKCRLESYGVAVIRAFSGMEGYRLAFTNPASAILLDYNMPDGQGDYILGRLKDNPVTRNIPVIVITGVRDKSLERKMYGLGAARFLTKPIRFDTLRDELSKHIEILSVPA
jgi:CheY-like chemotaxis protein